MFLAPLFAVVSLFAPLASSEAAQTPFDRAFAQADEAVRAGKKDAGTRELVQRALELDRRSIDAWELFARFAEEAGDPDTQAFALHQVYRLARTQERSKEELKALDARVRAVDPLAADRFALVPPFIEKLRAVAAQYEKDKRPHSAIRVHREILALDPDDEASAQAIEKLAAAPDPSLAEDAKPKDLLADVSEEWIRKFDAKHASWSDKAKLERENYITYTNTGYANLVRTAEAMEQMNAFYREFFQFGTEEHPGTVPRIELRIFKSHADYLKHGSSPVEWSGGQYTGAAVETFISSTFEDALETLFHEAAHQFVDLATNAEGWLNEGLASFFEGCRILSNGTVLMNLPANHRLFPLVDLMKGGWMRDHEDGVDRLKPENSRPTKAPTFRIVLENRYTWGPPWYAPTWGVVYFLYNYQDPVDGRFVYRSAFRTYIDKTGGKMGEGAIRTFEELVLANPAPPIKGVERPKNAAALTLPKTVDELTEVWKDWMFALAKEQTGELTVERPHFTWAKHAVRAKDYAAAQEHFEKALAAAPDDPDVNLEFAAFLGERKQTDRASKLAVRGIQLLEAQSPRDEAAIKAAEQKLEKWDPKRKAHATVRAELVAALRALVQRYEGVERPRLVMDLAGRFGTEFAVPELLDAYAAAYRKVNRSLEVWSLAYDEASLDGWAASEANVFKADGPTLRSDFGAYSAENYDYRMLMLDTITSGDFTLEAEVRIEKGKATLAGLVFGVKDINNYHGLLLLPGRKSQDAKKSGLSDSGFIDLTTCTGGANFKIWRHNPVKTAGPSTGAGGGGSSAHRLRIDVAGSLVDTWFDGEFLSTQDFGTPDVLRGKLGLLVGMGEARFSDIRFLARAPRDPIARIERSIRMEKFEKAGNVSADGSYLGKIPPWPKAKKWVQGERKSWDERNGQPQLFVLWSTQQNEIVAIDAWLNDLAMRYADARLDFVCMASVNDEAFLPKYLESHPMPGSVCLDDRTQDGIGDSFTMFAIDRFNLPRLLLLDVDGKVVWEGDPGFTSSAPWRSGVETYLDAPLADLVAKRKLRELAPWLATWNEKAKPALAAGDVATALPVLKQAQEFGKGSSADIDAALAKLSMLEGALASVATTAASFQKDEADPALDVLVQWCAALGKKIDKNTQFTLKGIKDGKVSKDWAECLKLLATVKAKAKTPDKLAAAQECAAKLETMSGKFVKEVLAELKAAIESGDPAKMNQVVADAPAKPMKWLVKEYFKW